MKVWWRVLVPAGGLILLLILQPVVFAQVFRQQPSPTEQNQEGSERESNTPQDFKVPRPDRITAVIYPFQSATVGTEVRGIVDLMNFKEGQPLKKGDVVAEISKERYEAIVGEFKANYDAVVRTLDRAREELVIQEELFEKRSSTYDDLQKARSQVQVLEARKQEAIHKLKQAELNLKACVVRAPFSGTISVLYHEPFETVDNLEKLFGVIDTSKVYARANWPESRLSELAIGKTCEFQYQGQVFHGVIEKLASLIDPASKSKRVHAIIDNSEGKLEVGMSGSLTVREPRKVSMDAHN
jgi:membrane fusion protein, multidrug efflux system